MSLRSRLKRLEQAIARPLQRWSFDQAMEDAQALCGWLGEHGFDDCLAAVEAKATPPFGLEGMVALQAKHDPRRRAWKRVEGALDEGELPAEADVARL